MKKIYLSLTIFVTMFIVGCSVVTTTNFEKISNSNYTAANKLIEKSGLKKDDMVIITTIANLNDLDESSDLGRALSEQISNVFVNHGIKVKELKFSNSVFIKRKNGEFILSRDVKKLAKDINVNYIVVGTYSIINHNVYVNLKIIDPNCDVIKASVDYIVPVYRTF